MQLLLLLFSRSFPRLKPLDAGIIEWDSFHKFLWPLKLSQSGIVVSTILLLDWLIRILSI